MKTIKKNVYYCDFCKKRGLSASSMSVHEKHCTANPNRECRLCGKKNISEIVNEFTVRFRLHPNEPNDIFTEDFVLGHEYKVEWIGAPVTLEEIRKSVGDCPNCILAVLRQCGFNKHYFEFERFDYSKELSEAWAEKNKEYDEDYAYYR